MRVVIVGAGVGGIATAIELRRHGFNDLRCSSAGPELGGTWRDNTYPGCACDVPSHLYSFSFAQRRDWSRLCSPQGEIRSYLERSPRARYHGAVRPASTSPLASWSRRMDACAAPRARLGGRRGDLATGQLHQPAFPRLEGRFAGHRFHSAAGTTPMTCAASGSVRMLTHPSLVGSRSSHWLSKDSVRSDGTVDESLFRANMLIHT